MTALGPLDLEPVRRAVVGLRWRLRALAAAFGAGEQVRAVLARRRRRGCGGTLEVAVPRAGLEAKGVRS